MNPLGLQSHQVPDSAMTASSYACKPQFGRLYLHYASGINGAWCAKTNDINQWLQVDFENLVKVQGVATQGRQESNQWVQSYRLSYGETGVFFKEYKTKEGENVRWESFIVSSIFY